MDTQLTGRKEECRRLSMCVSEDSAQLIVVYGRRRIGKTWLIEKFFDGDFAFRVTGEYDAPANMQLRNFANELGFQTGVSVQPPRDWKEAFVSLRQYLTSLPSDVFSQLTLLQFLFPSIHPLSSITQCPSQTSHQTPSLTLTLETPLLLTCLFIIQLTHPHYPSHVVH